MPTISGISLGRRRENFWESCRSHHHFNHEEEEEKYCRINKNLRENCTRQIWRRCCFVLFFRQTSWQTKQRFPPSSNIQGPLLMFIAMQGGDFGERKTRIVINHFFSRYDTIRENTRNGSFPPWRVYWTRKRIPPLPSSLPPPFQGAEWWILPPFPSYTDPYFHFFLRIAKTLFPWYVFRTEN